MQGHSCLLLAVVKIDTLLSKDRITLDSLDFSEPGVASEEDKMGSALQ